MSALSRLLERANAGRKRGALAEVQLARIVRDVAASSRDFLVIEVYAGAAMERGDHTVGLVLKDDDLVYVALAAVDASETNFGLDGLHCAGKPREDVMGFMLTAFPRRVKAKLELARAWAEKRAG